MKNSFQILVEKPEENKQDGSHRLTRDDGIKLDLEVGYECVWTAFICFRTVTGTGLF
jgi:hypothetical protein